jgi:hypothetical protein
LDKTFIEKKNINPKPKKDIENIILVEGFEKRTGSQ